MIHVYKKGVNPEMPTLVLLHGTGGNETDLINIGEYISPSSSLLGVRGNVLENGMPRFFRRLAEGVFDIEDLKYRTKELHDFLNESAEKYGFDRSNMVAVGYSNGANIAASLLFHYERVLKGAILFHPMVPLRGIPLPNMTDIPVFIGAGKNDPLIPAKESEELANMLTGAGAEVETFWGNRGHQLTPEELRLAIEWFKKHYIVL
ncbi:MAG: alpha/beta hydrolase [Tuberibacillus sp.]